MKQKSIISRVSIDMFLEQMKWSLWFIVFVLVSYIVVIAISINTGSNSSDFFGFSYGSTKVYMLVIGIISASAFLTFYVKHGVTRKDYFIGSILAIIFLSITLTLIPAVLVGVEYIIFDISNLSQSDSFLNFNNNWFLLVNFINIFTYYLIGWLLGAGYYRFGWILGFGFIALSIIF